MGMTDFVSKKTLKNIYSKDFIAESCKAPGSDERRNRCAIHMIAAVGSHSISKLHHVYKDKELRCMREPSSQFISGQKFGSLFAVQTQKCSTAMAKSLR